MGNISQSPITRYSFTGVDTVPVQSVSFAGKATWDGYTLTITDYDPEEIINLKRYDGILVGNQLAILASQPSNVSSTVIRLTLIESRKFTSNFSAQNFKVAKGIQNSEFPLYWHIDGSDYTIEGVPYTTSQNFCGRNALQLVNASSTVSVGIGHITSSGNASGGGGGGGGQTPAGAMHVITLEEGEDYTVSSYATLSIHIVGEEATFNGETIDGVLAQSGAFVYNDDINSVTPVEVTVGRNTKATIIYRELAS